MALAQREGWQGPLQRVLLGLLTGYQRFLSPLLGSHCRFHPSCSAYALEAIQSHGPLRGLWLGVRRLLRCHPWHPGGYDPVPPPQPGPDAQESR